MYQVTVGVNLALIFYHVSYLNVIIGISDISENAMWSGLKHFVDSCEELLIVTLASCETRENANLAISGIST